MKSNWFPSHLPRPGMGICFFPGVAAGFQSPRPTGGVTTGALGPAAPTLLKERWNSGMWIALISAGFFVYYTKDFLFITPRTSLAWRSSKIKYLALLFWHNGGGTAGDAPCTGNVGSHQKGHIPYSPSSTISWTQIFNAYPSPIFIKSHLLSACSGSKLSHFHGRIDATQYWDDTFNLRLRWLFGLIS